MPHINWQTTPGAREVLLMDEPDALAVTGKRFGRPPLLHHNCHYGVAAFCPFRGVGGLLDYQ
jgi:hypothetical protein